jgi:CBS-domain-containing membrane protein
VAGPLNPDCEADNDHVSTVVKYQLNRWQSITLAAVLVSAVIALLKYLGDLSKHPLLIAPFAATLMLIFSVTRSPFVRTKNIVGGYIAGSMSAIALYKLFGANIWTLAASAGITVLVMEIMHTLHPPAVALPIAMVSDHESWSFLWTPLTIGVAILVAAAFAHKQFIKRFPIHVA